MGGGVLEAEPGIHPQAVSQGQTCYAMGQNCTIEELRSSLMWREPLRKQER